MAPDAIEYLEYQYSLVPKRKSRSCANTSWDEICASDPDIADRAIRLKGLLRRLTKAQIRVAALVSRGYSHSRIASMLHVSTRTIDNHCHAIRGIALIHADYDLCVRLDALVAFARLSLDSPIDQHVPDRQAIAREERKREAREKKQQTWEEKREGPPQKINRALPRNE